MLGRSLAWPNPRCAKEKRLRFMFSNCFAKVSCVFLPLFVAATIMADDTPTPTVADSTRLDQGRLIYAESCQSCHGDQGQGIADGYDKPLVGDDSVGQLSSLIAETMPEGEPEQCVGDDADAVAAYIHHAFYSEAARVRNRPPRLAVTHLTANQLRQSLADLYGAFYGAAKKESTRGIRGRYFTTTKRNDDNKKIERVDEVIAFDWQDKGPGAEIQSEEFSIEWAGGLKIDETGRYEIVIRSTCAFICNLGHSNREFINNRVQSGDKVEFRKSIVLTAGRVYPIRIELYQRKRKTQQPPATISLSWVSPNSTERILPSRNLLPVLPPPSFSLQTKLPPDDRSYGFDRGLSVDRQWDDSTTAAAVEFAGVAINELWPHYRRKHKNDSDQNRQRLRSFLLKIAETAFRGPLDDLNHRFYVDQQVDQSEDDSEAIKRCLLAVLKSPRFLYPELDRDRSVSQRAANRLALTLFDSVPVDESLLQLVRQDKLETEEQVRTAARQMVRDYRAEGKIHQLVGEWLHLSRISEAVKDSELFPDFDPELQADLKASLTAFTQSVIESDASDFRQMFLADWSFTTDQLADFYGEAWQYEDLIVAKDVAVEVSAEAATEIDSDHPQDRKATKESTVETKAKVESVDEEGRQQDPPLHSNLAVDDFGGITHRRLLKTRPIDSQHFGLLSHPYLLSGLAYQDSTSPIHRGVFLIRYLLGRSLRPPNEAFTPLAPDLHPDMTTRERVQLQTSPQSCQVCHAKINGLGFVLENFDAVGRYRFHEGEKPIDSSGGYTTRTGQKVDFQGVSDLAHYLAGSSDAHRAFVNRSFQYFTKQPIAAYGVRRLDRLTGNFRENDFHIRNLVVEIATIAATQPIVSSEAPSETRRAAVNPWPGLVAQPAQIEGKPSSEKRLN